LTSNGSISLFQNQNVHKIFSYKKQKLKPAETSDLVHSIIWSRGSFKCFVFGILQRSPFSSPDTFRNKSPPRCCRRSCMLPKRTSIVRMTGSGFFYGGRHPLHRGWQLVWPRFFFKRLGILFVNPHFFFSPQGTLLRGVPPTLGGPVPCRHPPQGSKRSLDRIRALERALSATGLPLPGDVV